MTLNNEISWRGKPDRMIALQRLLLSAAIRVFMLWGIGKLVLKESATGNRIADICIFSILGLILLYWTSWDTLKYRIRYIRAEYRIENNTLIATVESTGARWEITPERVWDLRLVIAKNEKHADLTWVHKVRRGKHMVQWPEGFLFVRDYQSLVTCLKSKGIRFQTEHADS